METATLSWRRLLTQAARRPDSRALLKAGRSIAAIRAMTAITTSTSMSVNARRVVIGWTELPNNLGPPRNHRNWNSRVFPPGAGLLRRCRLPRQQLAFGLQQRGSRKRIVHIHPEELVDDAQALLHLLRAQRRRRRVVILVAIGQVPGAQVGIVLRGRTADLEPVADECRRDVDPGRVGNRRLFGLLQQRVARFGVIWNELGQGLYRRHAPATGAARGLRDQLQQCRQARAVRQF